LDLLTIIKDFQKQKAVDAGVWKGRIFIRFTSSYLDGPFIVASDALDPTEIRKAEGCPVYGYSEIKQILDHNLHQNGLIAIHEFKKQFKDSVVYNVEAKNEKE
jgi:hypothetical protein